MKSVLLDFNGTLFFDSSFHKEAWAEIYRELNDGKEKGQLDSSVLGARNDDIIQKMAPELTPSERDWWSDHKESLYREMCKKHPEKLRLVAGAPGLFQKLTDTKVPFILASASICPNIDFYFETFGLEQWFDREMVVYDDGTYENKGAMHIEAAKRLGVTLQDCVVVEDSLHAISLAKELGAGLIIGIGSDSIHPELIRAGATYCIKDFTEFDMQWLRN